MNARQVARGTLLLMAGSLLSRLLGVGREATIVGLYGVSGTASAFLTAATIPTMVYDLLIGGTMTASLIPLLAKRNDVPCAQRALAATFLGVGVAAAILLAVALGFAAVPLAHLLGAGASTESLDLTATLIRLVLPGIPFLVGAAVLQALLNARGSFGTTALASGGFNLGIVLLGLALAPTIGPVALAMGLVVGALLQFAVQSWPLRRHFPWPTFSLADPAIRQAHTLASPVALGLVVSQAIVILDRALAWSTGPESIAVMRAATTLVQLPLGLFGTALSLAILPALATIRAQDAFAETLALGLRASVSILIPTTILLVLLREPIVRVLFERGAFDAAATALVAQAFLLYAAQIPFWAADQILIAAYYARHRPLTPVLVGLGTSALFVIAALALVGPFGVQGLILANTIQNVAHCVILGALAWRDGMLTGRNGLVLAVVRSVVAAAAASAVVAALAASLEGADGFALFARLVVVGGAATGVAAATLGVLGRTDLQRFLGRSAP